MADHGWKEAAALAIAEKRAVLVKEISNADKAAERAVAKAGALKSDLEALDTSVRVLGIDLLDSYLPAPQDEAGDHGSAPLVKEIVLRALEDSYPLPMRAADVKVAIEKEIGRTVHDKTPGMTLYRLSKDKLVHREGRDWFFVPQEGAATPEVTSGFTLSEAERRAARYQEMLEDPGEQGPAEEDWEDAFR